MVSMIRRLRLNLAEWLARADLHLRGFNVSVAAANRLFDSFRALGALTATKAQPVHLHSDVEEYAFGSLLNLGVFREASAGRYYLDEASLETYRRRGLPL